METKSAFKVGLVTLLALIILALIITWKSNIFGRARGYKIFGSFDNVGGLLEGSEVRYRGFVVGAVERVDPGVQKAIATLLVKEKVKIPQGSYLRIAYDGLIGQKYIDIMPGEIPQPALVCQPGTVLEGRSTSGIVDFIDVGTANLEELKKIVTAIREFITSPQIKTASYQIMANVEETSNNLKKLVKEIRDLSVSEQDAIKSFIENFREISEKLKSITENVAGFLGDPKVAADFKATLENIKNFSERMDNIMVEAEATFGDKQFVADLKSAVTSTKQLIASTNSMVRRLAETKVRGDADLLAGRDNRDVKFRATLNITQNKGQRLFRVGLGKINDNLKLTDLQYGNRFSFLGSRVGIFNAEPAVGVDTYLFEDKVTLSSDLYDPDNLKLDLRGLVGFTDNLGFYLWAEDVINKTNRKYYLGVKVSP